MYVFTLRVGVDVQLYSSFNLDARWGWVVKATPLTLYILYEAGSVAVAVWTGTENLVRTGIRFPNFPARSESLYRLSYKAIEFRNKLL
jgi:hypothetical protein